MHGIGFRIFLLIGLAGIAYYAFARKNRLPVHIVLVLTMLSVGALFVIFPDVANVVAHAFGLWRGADLVTYTLEILLLFVALHYASRFVEVEDHLTTVVRRVALLEAELEEARRASSPRESQAQAGSSEPS